MEGSFKIDKEMKSHRNIDFLPTTLKEVKALGWEQLDVILISGDAYVDHPSFGVAVIGRLLSNYGYKVAIVPQPNWQDDLRDFKKLGVPKLFFGITSGNMDSMVNHYTATKRLRSQDAYTPGGATGFRPDYATTVYAKIVKELFPSTPVILGGIEASMRRLSHYDYWSDQLKPSILIESNADILVYGMGEKPILALAELLRSEENWRNKLFQFPQIAYVTEDSEIISSTHNHLILHSFEKEKENKRFYGENFALFEEESNKVHPKTLIQPYNHQYVVVNPPYPPLSEKETEDLSTFESMSYLPHYKYAKRGAIAAYEMIKNSITTHRGCFGGCSFCAISAHQGKFISSRSEESILKEVKLLTQRPYFKGHITDLGGPSANMYKMGGKDRALCKKCKKSSCIFPTICKNLQYNHLPLLSLYEKVAKISGVKKVTIGSGIRYDMLLTDNQEVNERNGIDRYFRRLVEKHVSGRLKVAPEHTSIKVLEKMRKPSYENFLLFLKKFNSYNAVVGKKQQLIPYFISAHPACTIEDMKKLARLTSKAHLLTEQVQDFTPTPMTYSTAMYYLGYDPYTNEKVYVARTLEEKREQKKFFFKR